MGAKMEILCDDRAGLQDGLFQKLESLCKMAIQQEGLGSIEGELSLTFVDRAAIQELNRQYRGVDRPTDVLSFPQYESKEEMINQAYLAIGDLIICLDIAGRQAADYGHSLEREVSYLFVHGLLHLLGYDHIEAEDKVEMRKLEEELLSKLDMSR